jgi:hypothetical protein
MYNVPPYVIYCSLSFPVSMIHMFISTPSHRHPTLYSLLRVSDQCAYMYRTVNDIGVLVLLFVDRIPTDGKKVSSNLIYSSHLPERNITGVYYGGGGGGGGGGWWWWWLVWWLAVAVAAAVVVAAAAAAAAAAVVVVVLVKTVKIAKRNA